MKREVRFRLWDKTSNAMKFEFGMNSEGKTGYYDKGSWKASDNIELMQWTGLKDKAGNDIYESDIVSFMYKYPNDHLAKLELVECEIVWNKSMWALKWKDGYINGSQLNAEKYTVVGNIYENEGL